MNTSSKHELPLIADSYLRVCMRAHALCLCLFLKHARAREHTHTHTHTHTHQDGARKAVDLPSPVDGGGSVPLMLMRYKNKIMATAAQCTRCKFPLVGASYENDSLKW